MNFLGIGGLELILVFLVALLVVGPVRLVQGAKTARKYMTELRRQREELTQMVEEAVDMEGIRERLDQDGVLDEVRDISTELNQFREEARSITTDAADFRSLANSVVRPSGYSRSSSCPRSPSEPDETDATEDVDSADAKPERSGAAS